MLISDSNLYFALMMIMGLKINLFIVKRNSIVSEEVNDEPSRLNLQIINNFRISTTIVNKFFSKLCHLLFQNKICLSKIKHLEFYQLIW